METPLSTTAVLAPLTARRQTQAARFEGLMTLPNKILFAVIPLLHSPREALRSNRPHYVSSVMIINERNKTPFKI